MLMVKRIPARPALTRREASEPLHHLRQDNFLKVDKGAPGTDARPFEVHCRFEDQLTIFHHQDAVGQRHRFFHVVGNQHRRKPAFQPKPLDKVLHLQPGKRVQSAQGLVKQDELCRARQGAPTLRLALTARKNERPLVLTCSQPDVFERGACDRRRSDLTRCSQQDILEN